jgi:hypothetical protein
MLLGERLALVLYGGWFALSVVRQWHGPIRRAVVRWDFFHLLPHWGYFSSPAEYDFTFTRRFRRAGGSHTDWVPVTLSRPRPRGAFLWHPQLLSRLVVRQFAAKAASVSTSTERRGILGSARYRLLVTFLAANAPPSDAVAMQFIVYASRQYDEPCRPQIAFLSEFHDL